MELRSPPGPFIVLKKKNCVDMEMYLPAMKRHTNGVTTRIYSKYICRKRETACLSSRGDLLERGVAHEAKYRFLASQALVDHRVGVHPVLDSLLLLQVEVDLVLLRAVNEVPRPAGHDVGRVDEVVQHGIVN